MKPRVLEPEILVKAYVSGYFPMPDPITGQILWYNPNPRAMIPLERFHCSRSLKKTMRQQNFVITHDQAFKVVIEACANRPDTWINQEIKAAYIQLFDLGLGHSIEVWLNDKLVGGLYGVSIFGAFFAESKFHLVTDASKVALYHLVNHLKQRNFKLLEVQFLTPHLKTLGAIEIFAEPYQSLLMQALKTKTSF